MKNFWISVEEFNVSGLWGGCTVQLLHLFLNHMTHAFFVPFLCANAACRFLPQQHHLFWDQHPFRTLNFKPSMQNKAFKALQLCQLACKPATCTEGETESCWAGFKPVQDMTSDKSCFARQKSKHPPKSQISYLWIITSQCHHIKLSTYV